MKLMIVDDDRQIREGIHYGIPWEEYGFEEVRDYEDGEDAWKELPVFGPDIVLADIRMPRMDGLELLKRIKAANISLRYILLSAYSDFEYCKKAIKLGADDYELKPIKPGRLIEVVQGHCKELQANRKKQEDTDSAYESRFLYTLTKGKSVPDVPGLRQLLKQKYGFDEDYVLISVLRVEDGRGNPGDYAGIARSLKQALSGSAVLVLDDANLLVISRGSNSALLNINHQHQLKSRIESFHDAGETREMRLTAGISSSWRLGEIHKAYLQARQALDLCFYYKPGHISVYEMELQGQKKEGETDTQKIMEQYTSLIWDAIKMSDAGSISGHLAHLKADMAKEKMDKKTITLVLSGIYTSLWTMVEPGAGVDVLNWKEDAPYIDLWFEKYSGFIWQIYEAYLIRSSVKGYSTLVKNIIYYVHQHYSEPVTVDALADVFQKSPNHISAKFKKEVGVSFTEYLTDIRMQEALRMLLNSDMHVYEIAERVGYSSYDYFSRTFKKKTGRSAVSYRKEPQENEKQ